VEIGSAHAHLGITLGGLAGDRRVADRRAGRRARGRHTAASLRPLSASHTLPARPPASHDIFSSTSNFGGVEKKSMRFADLKSNSFGAASVRLLALQRFSPRETLFRRNWFNFFVFMRGKFMVAE